VRAANSPLPLAGEGQGVRAANSLLPLGEGQGVRAANSLLPLGEGQGVRGDCPNFRVSENGTVPFGAGTASLAQKLEQAR
jgi:hypothetical protein